MIMETSEFENMVFKFNCEKDPITGTPFEVHFDNSRFKNFSAGSTLGLFKYAAMEMINSIEDLAMKELLSIRY